MYLLQDHNFAHHGVWGCIRLIMSNSWQVQPPSMTHAGALRQDEAALRPNGSLLIVFEHVLLGNGVIGAAPVGRGKN